MIESEEVKFRKRRSSQEIRRLVTKFEASGLRQLEFCKSRGLAQLSLLGASFGDFSGFATREAA